jgi:hypothetical protein
MAHGIVGRAAVTTPDDWRALPMADVLVRRIYRTRAKSQGEEQGILEFLRANPGYGLVRDFDSEAEARLFIRRVHHSGIALRVVRDDTEVYVSLPPILTNLLAGVHTCNQCRNMQSRLG